MVFPLCRFAVCLPNTTIMTTLPGHGQHTHLTINWLAKALVSHSCLPLNNRWTKCCLHSINNCQGDVTTMTGDYSISRQGKLLGRPVDSRLSQALTTNPVDLWLPSDCFLLASFALIGQIAWQYHCRLSLVWIIEWIESVCALQLPGSVQSTMAIAFGCDGRRAYDGETRCV